MIRTLSSTFSLLLAATMSAAGVEVAPPLVGRMVAAGGSVVSNGEGFLAVWQAEGGGVFVTAIDREGRRSRDAVTLRPGCGPPLPFQSGYVVTCSESSEVTIRRLDQYGLETGVIPVGPPLAFAGVVATSGDRMLVAPRNGNFVLRVIDASGRQVGPTIDRPDTTLLAAEPSESGFIVLSSSVAGVTVDAISREGALLHRGTFSGTPQHGSFAMAAIGDDVVVAWPSATGFLASAAISGAGLVTTNSWVESGVTDVRLVAGGDSILLIGRRRPSHPKPGVAAVGRLARDGTRLVPAVTIESDLPMNGFAVSNDLLYIVGQRGRDVVGVSVPLSALSSPPREEILSIGPLPQQGVTTAVVGDAVFVVWREQAANGALVRGRYVRAGEPIGSTTTVADTASMYSLPLAVASNGSMALIVWIDEGRVLAKRIDATGSIVDHDPVTIAPHVPGYGYFSISVASDGRDFVVAWVEASHKKLATMAAVVAADGAVGPGRALLEPLEQDSASSQWRERKALSLEWAGDRYLLVWVHEHWGHAGYGYLILRELRMTAFDRDLATTRMSETVISRDLEYPSIAAGSGFLGIVAEYPEPSHPEHRHPVALMVDSTSGSVVAQHPLGRGEPSGRSGLGAAAWTGYEFALAWHSGPASYLTRLTIGGTPRHSFMVNHPSEVTLAVTPDGDVHYLAVEGRVTSDAVSPRVVAYRDDDFTPLVPAARARGVRR